MTLKIKYGGKEYLIGIYNLLKAASCEDGYIIIKN